MFQVLDYFGCEVPVCAIGFDCIGELVQDGVNGNIFASGEELATLLLDLLSYHIYERLHKLEAYKKNIRGMTRWKENWEECARSLIVGDSP
jgi:beta-1,4-mannosyltransferase